MSLERLIERLARRPVRMVWRRRPGVWRAERLPAGVTHEDIEQAIQEGRAVQWAMHLRLPGQIEYVPELRTHTRRIGR